MNNLFIVRCHRMGSQQKGELPPRMEVARPTHRAAAAARGRPGYKAGKAK